MSGLSTDRLGAIPNATTRGLSRHSTRPTLSRTMVSTSPMTVCVITFCSNNDWGIHAELS